jgi:signal transduction histidine kinase/DNA-binding response OmpR family regulator
MNIRTKLMLLGLGCIFVTAIAMVTVGVWQGNTFSAEAKGEAARLVDADLTHTIAGVYHLIATQDASIQQKVDHDLTVARYLLNNHGKISLSSETVPWLATNQTTRIESRIVIPKMLIDKQWIGQNRLTWVETPVVDQIKRLVGGTATIFQRISDKGDLLGVATNVEKKDGTRAIGTYMPAVHPDGTQDPVVATVMRGETFRGIAYMVNAWYVTAYEPLYGSDGSIIGALCVGVKHDDVKALRKAIEQIVIGKTGYVFAIGGRGNDRGRYIISKNGLRDGEDLYGITDASGRKFIQSIISKAIACKPGQYATERYPWKNPGERTPRMKIARLAYYEPWDWVIGATAYEDEINQSMALFSGGYRNMIRMLGLVAVAVAVVAGIITWLYAHRMSDALMVVTRAATKLTEQDLPLLMDTMKKVNDGDLNVTFQFHQDAVKVSSRDELGTMAAAFTSMNTVLVEVGLAFTQMVASLRDLTGKLEERVAERTEELAQSKRKMADIIDFLPDATLVIDQNGRVIAWNLAMEKLTGIPSAQMIGKAEYEYGIPFYGRRQPILIDQVLRPDPDREENYQGFRREGNTLYGETRSVHLKDEEVYLFAAASALFDSNGARVGAIETLRDITDWKKIEKELIAAKLTAEEATQARSDFLANMSHEIRTPMNGVIGMTSLLLQTGLSDEQCEYARTIQSSAETLLTIINDILDFSKIEAGKLEFENIDFDLRFTLDEITEILSVKAEEKQLEFIGFVQPEVPSRLLGDPGRLRQVLLNLASNAIKFTSTGEVVIEAELVEENQDRVKLRFSVKDTGIGIPANRLDCLFKSFSQVDSSTTRQFGGTGLGLAISRRLVEMMDGQISVESEEGRGSNFWFTVELNKPATANRDEARPVMPEDIRGKRILAVDDNPTNRKIIKSYLKAWQCRATVAPDADQAMALLTLAAENDMPFEMAIIDFMMPGMDGETLGKAIKENPVLKDTRLILLTSRGMRGDAARAHSMGFEAYLTKPIKQSFLFNAILAVFGKQGQGDPDRRQDKGMITLHSLAESGKRKLRILLAEDNAVNQKVALIHLRKFGFSADVAENGREAVEAVKKGGYDLVLMDIQMPEMDGHEATRTIRGAGFDLPIIAMTANAMKGDREKCLEAGMNDYLAKPVNPKELLAKIEQWSELPEIPENESCDRLKN